MLKLANGEVVIFQKLLRLWFDSKEIEKLAMSRISPMTSQSTDRYIAKIKANAISMQSESLQSSLPSTSIACATGEMGVVTFCRSTSQ